MFKSNDLKFLIIMKILKNCNGFCFGLVMLLRKKMIISLSSKTWYTHIRLRTLREKKSVLKFPQILMGISVISVVVTGFRKNLSFMHMLRRSLHTALAKSKLHYRVGVKCFASGQCGSV